MNECQKLFRISSLGDQERRTRNVRGLQMFFGVRGGSRLGRGLRIRCRREGCCQEDNEPQAQRKRQAPHRRRSTKAEHAAPFPSIIFTQDRRSRSRTKVTSRAVGHWRFRIICKRRSDGERDFSSRKGRTGLSRAAFLVETE